MLNAIAHYFLNEIFPRWKAMLFGSELWVSVLAGFVAFNDCGFSRMESTKNGDIGILLLTYAAIALGFTLTGMTIALTLPEREFAHKLATTKIHEKGKDAYADLLFVFSWTATVHWVLLLSVICFLVYFGFDNRILHEPVLSHGRRWAVGILAFETIYCLCQFLITVITLSQVGSLYIKFLHKKDS